MRSVDGMFGIQGTQENVGVAPTGPAIRRARRESADEAEAAATQIIIRRMNELCGQLTEKDRQLLLLAAEQMSQADLTGAVLAVGETLPAVES